MSSLDDFLGGDEVQLAPYIPPRKTHDYIQLRFQLARFRVYRTVHLPLTFTFANLHTLIQYMFGWSDSHLHKAEVFPNVVRFDGDSEALVGTIKSCGRRRPLEDYELGDPSAIDHWRRFELEDQPIYRVQPKVTRRKDRFDGVMTMEEKSLTLESIWSLNKANNVSDGQCSNVQIGIVYTYDFGDEWTVHITCEGGDVFHHLDAPSNLPIFKLARGAPPIEHAQWDIPGEYDAEDKKVPQRFFDVSYFQGYCEGSVTSESRKTELEILTLEEKKDRVANEDDEYEDEDDGEGDEYEEDEEDGGDEDLDEE